ncbi:MAG: 4Fe-4S ferredoxin [Methanomicrobiales archaeon]|nr:4Fe-4S ferredoxin [Methanomicrobiales archaeon]
MKIGLLYFSATGNTEKIARVIEDSLKNLGCMVDIVDITPLVSRKAGLDCSPYDALILGAPVHSWRIPRVVREWILNLSGEGKKCALFLTYGGFQIHPAHYTTQQLVQSRGFKVVSSAEFLAFHTFNIGGWKAMEGRPDDSDFKVAREYAEKVYSRFSGEDPNLVGELEKTTHPEELLDQIEEFRFRIVTQLPTRNGADCCMCLACEKFCPTGAINATTGETNQGRCITCLGCVYRCPDGVLVVNDMSPSWEYKLKGEQISVAEMKKKRSRIYL